MSRFFLTFLNFMTWFITLSGLMVWGVASENWPLTYMLLVLSRLRFSIYLCIVSPCTDFPICVAGVCLVGAWVTARLEEGHRWFHCLSWETTEPPQITQRCGETLGVSSCDCSSSCQGLCSTSRCWSTLTIPGYRRFSGTRDSGLWRLVVNGAFWPLIGEAVWLLLWSMRSCDLGAVSNLNWWVWPS